jgi:hypothetical protein
MAASRSLRIVKPGETDPDEPAPVKNAAAKKTVAKRSPAKKAPAKQAAAKRTGSAAKKAPAKKAPAKKTTTASAEKEAPADARAITSLLDAIERGTYEDVLVWQRKNAVKALSTLAGPALAAMHRQIASLSKEIESIRAAKTEGTDIGEAAALPDEEYDEEAD